MFSKLSPEHFLKKLLKKIFLKNPTELPDEVILFTTNAAELYQNIINEKEWCFNKNSQDKPQNKYASTSSLTDLAELALENNNFEFNDRFRTW